MLLAKNNAGEYKELLGLSVEDFLIRFKLFISEIEQAQEVKTNTANKIKTSKWQSK
jgi:hypothetical protein